MTGSQIKNSALTTALAFHYQVLIGLEKCFDMREGQSIWFELDGDVSIINKTEKNSTQIEIKNYSDVLTDHHENFWKTLKNWVAPEFKHEDYSSLILHTTQAFGATTLLKDWNLKTVEERLEIINKIYATRTQEELAADKPKIIVKLQKEVMSTEIERLSDILAKVVLFTQADDEDSVYKKIQMRLDGFIPKANQKNYLDGVVGFVYTSADSKQWSINKDSFDEKREELTAVYCRKQFTFPEFTGREATQEELSQLEEKLFVQKINKIKYDDVISDAIGNWIELQNALIEELDGFPYFRDKTNEYQKKLVKRLKLNYSTAQLSCTSPERDSKIFYNNTIAELPLNLDSETPPPIEYKNGLIHDAMDDEDLDIKWSVDL
ncbi:MAG: hypothetical protein QM500_07480 [Methylococcales bacterium]